MTQLALSPYDPPGAAVAALDAVPARGAIDPVSVADLLRNAFVHPPHTIYRDVKTATFGFSPADNLRAAAPRFTFAFHEAGGASTPPAPTDNAALVARYHQLLCEAVSASTRDMRAPWVLQSGGKDSTSLAIAMADARPDAKCLTYLGGREENELESAAAIARTLGLQHESLVCDPGRCYDRYLALVPRLPLLTGDFAWLSYIDLATEIALRGGDGIVDGLGSDVYFGFPVSNMQRGLMLLARSLRLPSSLTALPGIADSFRLCFALGTLQMSADARHFPGSRFSDAEVDALLGARIADRSHQRMSAYAEALARAASRHERRAILMSVCEGASAFAKGTYTAHALHMGIAYPFCDEALRDWVYREVPPDLRVDAKTGRNKLLVREHVATRFATLPYVQHKGSFRFDLVGLAQARFEQVLAFAEAPGTQIPGAAQWLKRHERHLHNKFHASRFYLLAVALPWLQAHAA